MVYTFEFVSGIQAIPSPGQIMARNATGRPRKKLVSELLNSIKGALLCWMFKFSNAAL